ncbi:MAG: prepilin-type N-terminal cleavage/methylation domain-containing protein [Thiomargarita sp.]|nr:prepilin-type N-terminal cleavage/methylation domain-containing protein [Thiomargarita sp.]
MQIFSIGKTHNNNAGFSLLELLVVLVMIGMLVTLVVPQMSSSDQTIFKTQVRKVITLLKATRRSAVVNGTERIAVFSKGDTDLYNIKITFYPEGGSSGGEIIVKHLKYRAKITISPITGKIESKILYE